MKEFNIQYNKNKNSIINKTKWLIYNYLDKTNIEKIIYKI